MKDTKLTERKLHLKILIESQEKMKKKKALTETGLSYLDGLKKAREILFAKRPKQ